jgi:membrane protein DedA with SNARE-associated domain
VIWVSGLAVLGREVGRNWTNWRHHLEYVDYVGAAVVVVVIVWLIIRRNSPDRSEPAVDAVSK